MAHNLTRRSFSESIGLALQQDRKRRGMTQTRVAEAAGLSRNTIVGVESGNSSVTLWNLKQICRAMGCSMVSIMARAEQIQRGEKPLPEAAGPH